MLAGLMPSYLTFALLAPVTGLTALTFITSANTYMQLHTDAGVRGRVMALYLMIFMGGTPDRRAHHRLDRSGVRRTLDAAGRRPAHDRRCGALGGPLPQAPTGRGASVTRHVPEPAVQAAPAAF